MPRCRPHAASRRPRHLRPGGGRRHEVADRLGWPLFIKGERQTSLHRGALSIAADPDDQARIQAARSSDWILRWQRPAVRRFVPLRRVGDHVRGIQASFEFRVFCWRGQPLSIGRYWTDHDYEATEHQLDAMRRLAATAAAAVDVPFLVVDVALTEAGEWIVVECNDAQESSYAANSPLVLWSGIVEHERRARGLPSPGAEG